MNAELARRLARETEGEVLFDAASRGRYATDASIYQIMPIGVFVPTTQRDVAVALQIAREMGAPVLPRGGGTSQCGQTTGAALVIDFSKHLRRVLALDVEARRVDVEPGLVLDHLNAELKKHGLWYPVDVSTSAQATLGGMAGNNSCGSRSIAYGNMVHNVAAIDAWLADGSEVRFGPLATLGTKERHIAAVVRSLAEALAPEIDEHWPTVMRRVAGYNLDIFRPRSERPYTGDGSVNLAHLLVGAEGTLALTRSLTLQLAPLPKAKVLGVINFASFHTAMDSAQHIVRLGPSAVELVDRTMIELSRANPAFRPVIEAALIGSPDAILLVEFSGDDRGALLKQLQALVELMGDLGLPGSVVEMPDETPQKALWEVRKAGLNIMMSLKGDGKPVSFIEDCAVPLVHLAEYTDALTEVFRRHGTRGTWYAHASVGTLHVRPILDMRRDGAQKMRAIADEAAALVRKCKGAYSGEHGDGLCRGEWIRWQFGPKIDEAFRAIKQALDPLNLMNPGKIVDPPRMDDARLFRFPPGYKTIPLKPVFDWSAWDVQNDPVTEQTTPPGTGGDTTGGVAKAVEMCNNNGHCRKFDAGTMWPSYRATGEEKDVTRGRANTLRLALSGQIGTAGLASDEVREALELCVACKGCRRECPTGVDMAKMKVEFLAQWRGTHPPSLRERLIAWLPRIAPAAARIAPVLNWTGGASAIGAPVRRALGFAAARTLPAWRGDYFRGDEPARPAAAAAKPRVTAEKREVALFADTFNRWFEPENVRAAREVLEAAGYEVLRPAPAGGGRPLCCGRTFLSVGLVEQAKAEARRTLAVLRPLAERGVSIVGLEPSCLYTLRDEFVSMLPGVESAEVALRATLFEEFVDAERAAGRFDLALSPLPQTAALLHGHCHQKAFGAMGSVERTLALVPGLAVEPVVSSCCGMAGAFGYEAEHYDLSMKMGEAALLPRVREASAETLLVADGTSCRHQIRDGAGREAVHVARVLRAALSPDRNPP